MNLDLNFCIWVGDLDYSFPACDLDLRVTYSKHAVLLLVVADRWIGTPPFIPRWKCIFFWVLFRSEFNN